MKQRGWMIRTRRRHKSIDSGVLTVLSQMGEPIDKLATRGVRLWSVSIGI